MRLLESLVHTPVANSLAWAIVHSLWQGAIAALIVGMAYLMTRSPRIRYAVASLALVAIFTGFVITLFLSIPGHASLPMAAQNRFSSAFSGVAFAPPIPGRHSMMDLLPWLTPFWIGGMCLFHLRSAAGWMAVRSLRRKGVCAPADGWQHRLDQLRSRLRVTKPIVLLETALAQSPAVIGYIRPVILTPAGMLTGMAVTQVDSILLHELAHIRRHDYLANLLQTLIEGTLFYHPAVWWISHVIRTERENCCDDLVVSVIGDARDYATALTVLEENRHALRQPALAATGGPLTKRIRRLLFTNENPAGFQSPFISAGILVLVGSLALSAWQAKPQAPATPLPANAPREQAPPQAPSSKQPPAPSATASNRASNEDRVFIITPADRAAWKALTTDEERRKFIGRLRPQLIAQAQPNNSQPQSAALPDTYNRWLNIEVPYIITAQERAAFEALNTDEERNQFIEQFWLRRDPTPGTIRNEFREEHYRRIAYANSRFASPSGEPGWKSDRGRIYIIFGPPDEIDSHPNGSATAPPSEKWRYRYIEGIGANVDMDFLDAQRNGEYHMTKDPDRVQADRIFRPNADVPLIQ